MRKTLLPMLGATALANAFAADRLSLAELERQVLAAPAVRIAQAERDAADARHRIAVADMSPRLFVSGSAASTKDPARPERYRVDQIQPDGTISTSERILTSAQERYGRYGAVVGVRIPLFGSRDISMRNIEVADAGRTASRAREQVARMEALKGLRYAYVDSFYRRQQAQLAEAYLEREADAERVFTQRTKARLLLDADNRALRTTFQSARTAGIKARTLAAASAARLKLATGRSVDTAELEAPTLPPDCAIPSADHIAPARLHPEIAMYAAALEEKRRMLAVDGAWRPESGVTISQGIQRYESGSSGTSTAISFDLQIPLAGRELETARKKLALSEVAKAELELDAKKAEFMSALENAQRELALRRSQFEAVAQRVGASKEAYRVSWLRAGQPNGDPVETMVRSKYALYQAFHEQIEAELQLAKAQIDMMGLARCDGGERRAGILPEALPLMSQALLPARAPASRKLIYISEQANAVNAAQNGRAPVLGWYAWYALNRFKPGDAAQFWSNIPQSNRVLLSLTSEQLRNVTAKQKERQRLSAFLDSARKRHVEVGLLLGDPGWVLPGEAGKLRQIVRTLAPFSFSSIHLDIEQSQLPQDQQALWADGMVAVVSSLREESHLPLAVSLHPRDLDVPGLLHKLRAAGANEVAVMQYSTDGDKVAGNLIEVMRRNPQLRFSVAQSIEPSLPREESYAKRPLKAVEAAWQDISLRLGKEPNFSGILVQSLDDYLNGALHEN